MIRSLCRRLGRWLTLRSLAPGQSVVIASGYSLDARLVFIQFTDPHGLRWDWTLTPDLAREWAWQLIGNADLAEQASEGC